ncbi:MAG: hypothetical protein ACLQT7_06180 [Candidatus Dormibacteria bacterium]
MASNGQGPSPRPRGGAQRRHGRGVDARRRDVGSQWGLLAAASHRGRGTAPAAAAARSARARRDDAGADFVLQAMQRAFQ